MAAIYRLLCTHCTFGTSALESSTADNAGKVFGYSVRRSSLPDSERVQLRAVFRAVERLLSYYLPKDAPPEKKESLDADCTPRRLIFLPNLGGWQAAAHVAYRTRDTAGRPGCYFADVLAAKSDGGKSLWSPHDVLQLWATGHDDAPRANWWCVSEEALENLEESGRGDLQNLTTPAELRGNATSFLDDDLLSQFLNLEPGEVPDNLDHIVAPRWWAIPAQQRQALMEAMLSATINTRKHNSKDPIVIAAEPSVAALLFYGVFRLLPEKLCAGIGFSTYESAPERSLTPLVATTFHDPEATNADLPAELYSRGFACNTFRDVAKYGRAQPVPEAGYVRHVAGLAVTGNWAALDGFLAAIDALQKPDFGSLDRLAEIETYVTDYVTGNKRRKKSGPEPSVERGSDKDRFRRARFRGLLTTAAEDRAADWPGDLLRTAVAWLGEEFPELWSEQGPVASVLKKRLPATNKELELLLRKVQDSPESTHSKLNLMVARAVIHVALAEHAKRIPQAFSDFIAAPKKDGGYAPPILQAGKFVEALLRAIVEEGHQHLLRYPSHQLVDPILDTLSTQERRSPGFVHTQQIPLLDILTWSLTDTYTSIRKRAEFLTRHSVLECLTRQCDCPREFTAAVDDFFLKLLRLIPGISQNHWDFLAVNGRSRLDALSNWLSAVKPENRSRYKEALEAWQGIHGAVSELKPVAERAGGFTALFPKLFPDDQPPRASLAKFTDAYGQLRKIYYECNTPIDLPLKVFLATPFSGLGVSEAKRPRMTRWLDRALNGVTRTRKKASFAMRRGKKKPSGKGAALRIGIATASFAVCVALAFALYPHLPTQQAIGRFFAGKFSGWLSTPTGKKRDQNAKEKQQGSAREDTATLHGD